MGDPQSKSDIGGHKLEPEELDDDDKLFLNSLRRDVRAVTTARPDSAAPSPAPSPRNSPTQNANSPISDDNNNNKFELNIADAVDDEDVHGHAHVILRDEFEKQLAAQQQTTNDLSSNPHEIDELSHEIARLNEELEKSKGKYLIRNSKRLNWRTHWMS
eukprot:178251_1